VDAGSARSATSVAFKRFAPLSVIQIGIWIKICRLFSLAGVKITHLGSLFCEKVRKETVTGVGSNLGCTLQINLKQDFCTLLVSEDKA
jgi:hypothetical protein